MPALGRSPGPASSKAVRRSSSFRDGTEDQTSDVQLDIGESRDSGFALRAPRNDVAPNKKGPLPRASLSVARHFLSRDGDAGENAGEDRRARTAPAAVRYRRPRPRLSTRSGPGR